MNTPHIKPEGKKIAETILLPGDPLRAKFIAETFLTDVVQFNGIRNAFGFTGKYNGKEISVMGTGMGMPSIGIYSHELIKFFNVKNLIRIGTCGAMQKHVNLYDVIIGMGASTNSNFAHHYDIPGTFAPLASYELLNKAVNVANSKNIPVNVGNILSSDIFYSDTPESVDKWIKMGILATEMEAAALYMTAARHNANALCILTVSDHIIKKEETTPEERQTAFTKMMEIALELA